MPNKDIDIKFKIVLYSHFFKVLNPSLRITNVLLKFCTKYVHYGVSRTGGVDTENFKVFATKTKDNREFRFHIGQYEHFLHFIEGVFTKDEYVIEVAQTFNPPDSPFKTKEGWVLKDYQESARDFMVTNDQIFNPSKLTTMPMGMGKTVTSMFSCSALGKRTAIIILPNYIEKWKSDVLGIIDIDPKRIMLVQGSKALKGLIHYGKEQDIKSDIVIFSLTTLRNFFTEYSERPAETIEEYGCTPEEMYQILGIGTVLIDEAHQHLHAIFRLMLHMHVPKLLALSATFIDDDRFIENMMKVMFPKELRFDDIKMEKYIQCYAYSYCFRDFRRSNIKTTEYGSKNYSHVAFERSLLKSKDKEVLPNYLKMIDSLIKTHWQEKYQQGDKAIVYAATIEMCTVIMNYLKTKYPGKLINKYTQGDPYSNIIESDICVSTIQSGGTAIDIPGLRFALMTTSISSSKSNLQTLGRLRKLKDRDVNFAYIYCEEIPKHLTYHLDKKVLFKDWVAYIKELRMSIRI